MYICSDRNLSASNYFPSFILQTMSVSFRLFVHAVKNTPHPDILLPDSKRIFLGRGPDTKIKDSRLSKKQLCLTADYKKKIVLIKILGSNPSVIAGEKLGKDKTKLLKIGEQFQLLDGQYQYELKVDLEETKEKKMAEKKVVGSAGPSSNHWSQGLYASMNNPDMKIYEDDQVVIIKDKYPKAHHHFLALPQIKIKDLASMDRSHIPILKHMHQKGTDLIQKYPESEFVLGYHAIPSMAQVHMHIISQDYDSPCLKTKKHWNSFTTEYLIPSGMVVKELESSGKFRLASPTEGKSLLDRALKCHKCAFTPKNMPDLKQHLKKHLNK